MNNGHKIPIVTPKIPYATYPKPFFFESAFKILSIEIFGFFILLSFVKNNGKIETNSNPETIRKETLKDSLVINSAPINGPTMAANLNRALIIETSDASCFLSENFVKYMWKDE